MSFSVLPPRAPCLQNTEKLLVADGLGRRAVALAMVIDLFCLVQHAVFHHQVHPAADAVIERRAVAAGQAKAERTVRWLGSPGADALRTHFAACGFVQFQRTDDAGVGCLGGPARRNRGQCFAVGRTALRHPRRRPGACRRARIAVDFFRGKVHAVQKAGDIESCAPHNDGSLPRAVSFRINGSAAAVKSATLYGISGSKKSSR